jgi:hypothetical protein
MVEGQTEFDREAWMLEELQLQDEHDEVLRLWEEQEAPRKLKGKKKKKAPSRLHRDEQRVAQRRAEAEKLVARLEAERAGEERERTDRRGLAQDDLEDSNGELCFEDPRQAAWARLPQDPREVPEDKVVLALRSLVRAAAKATAEATESWRGSWRRQRPRGRAWRRSNLRSSTREEECRFVCEYLG